MRQLHGLIRTHSLFGVVRSMKPAEVVSHLTTTRSNSTRSLFDNILEWRTW
jgi:hypothetical protein